MMRNTIRAIAADTLRRLRRDNVMLVAAGVTFYVVLAIFPGVALLVRLADLLFGLGRNDTLLPFLSDVLPPSAHAIIEAQISSAQETQRSAGSGATAGVWPGAAPFISGLVLLWSTNAGVKAVFNALALIRETAERRGFLRLTLVTLAFTLGLLVFLVLATGLVLVAPIVFARLGPDMLGVTLLRWLRWPLLLVVAACGLFALYRYSPTGTPPPLRSAIATSVGAALAWLLSSLVFSWFVTRFVDFSDTYGSLGSVAAFMLWLWISFVIVLGGAEVEGAVRRARD